MKSDDLDKLLSERKFEEASPELAARIIAQAKPRIDARAELSWSDLFRAWLTPKVLAVLAVVFVVGLGVGHFVPIAEEMNGESELADFLYYEEVLPWQTN